MEKLLGWWKRDKRYLTMVKAVLLALLPVLCCLVYCASHGSAIGKVYLPASEWNDELFYFKQVEGIVHYGYPQGYFGFNESHALRLSFAAWSPVLVFPWVLWGLLFGWNLMSPILCNIFLMTLCCFLFVWLVKPDWKQTGIMALLFCLYTPFVRYMLSGMPEVICFSMLILFYGLAINYLNRERIWKLVLLFVMSGVMTLMRPYLLLFMLLPAFFRVRKKRLVGALGSGLAMAAVLGIYACIKHYLGAEYFAPLFFTDWVTGGIRYTLGKLYYMGRDFGRHTLQGIRTGLASGAYFGSYLIMLCILLFQSISDYRLLRRRRREADGQAGKPSDEDTLSRQLIIEVHMVFSFVAMLFALLLMYKLTEGSKHLLTFMAAGIFVVAMMRTGFYKKAVLLGVTFLYFFSYKAVDPYDYLVPFATEERQAKVEEWTAELTDRLELVMTDTPSFDNVVIWVFSDVVGEESINTDWPMLYGLPEGFGISCCMSDYVAENLDSLESRYLFVQSDGEIDALCRDAGYEEIWRDGNSVLYRRY